MYLRFYKLESEGLNQLTFLTNGYKDQLSPAEKIDRRARLSFAYQQRKHLRQFGALLTILDDSKLHLTYLDYVPHDPEETDVFWGWKSYLTDLHIDFRAEVVSHPVGDCVKAFVIFPPTSHNLDIFETSNVAARRVFVADPRTKAESWSYWTAPRRYGYLLFVSMPSSR